MLPSPDGLEFARLDTADIAALSQLECLCFSMPWSEQQFAGAFCQKSFAAFGLRCHTALIAYVSIYHVVDEMEILNIAVDPAHRRQGHGKTLLGLVLQVARKMHIERAVLEVRVHNSAALALYTSLHFKKVGERLGYYADTGENALIYQCIFD